MNANQTAAATAAHTHTYNDQAFLNGIMVNACLCGELEPADPTACEMFGHEYVEAQLDYDDPIIRVCEVCNQEEPAEISLDQVADAIEKVQAERAALTACESDVQAYTLNKIRSLTDDIDRGAKHVASAAAHIQGSVEKGFGIFSSIVDTITRGGADLVEAISKREVTIEFARHSGATLAQIELASDLSATQVWFSHRAA